MPKKKPEVVADVETCGSCRFFFMDDPKDDAGYCKRFPPQHVESEDGSGFTYAVNMPDEWCGEYKRRTQ